jgi:hypothetical protein
MFAVFGNWRLMTSGISTTLFLAHPRTLRSCHPTAPDSSGCRVGAGSQNVWMDRSITPYGFCGALTIQYNRAK